MRSNCDRKHVCDHIVVQESYFVVLLVRKRITATIAKFSHLTSLEMLSSEKH